MIIHVWRSRRLIVATLWMKRHRSVVVIIFVTTCTPLSSSIWRNTVRYIDQAGATTTHWITDSFASTGTSGKQYVHSKNVENVN